MKLYEVIDSVGLVQSVHKTRQAAEKAAAKYGRKIEYRAFYDVREVDAQKFRHVESSIWHNLKQT